MSISSLRGAWETIPPPPKGADATAVPIRGTNAWVLKTPNNGFGLVLTGVARPLRVPTFKNLSIVYKSELEFEEKGGRRRVYRCLEMLLEPPFDTDTLGSIVDRLIEKEPSGTFPTELLIDTLQDVRDILETLGPGPSKEEVIGAWGELWLVDALIMRSSNADRQQSILAAWESQLSTRDILDFRFTDEKAVIEVKTTLGRRVHHIQSFDQVTVPTGFRDGYLASLIIKESSDRSGRTSLDLTQSIKAALRGNAAERRRLESILDRKIALRGPACLDARYDFLTSQEALALFVLASVPRPPPTTNVIDVEWTADLTSVASVDTPTVAKIMDSLAGVR